MAGIFAGRGVSERNQEKVNLKIPEKMRNRQAPRGQGSSYFFSYLFTNISKEANMMPESSKDQ